MGKMQVRNEEKTKNHAGGNAFPAVRRLCRMRSFCIRAPAFFFPRVRTQKRRRIRFIASPFRLLLFPCVLFPPGRAAPVHLLFCCRSVCPTLLMRRYFGPFLFCWRGVCHTLPMIRYFGPFLFCWRDVCLTRVPVDEVPLDKSSWCRYPSPSSLMRAPAKYR